MQIKRRNHFSEAKIDNKENKINGLSTHNKLLITKIDSLKNENEKLKFEYAVWKGINEALGKQFGEVNQQGEPCPSLVSKNVEQDPNTNSISASTSDSTSKLPQMVKRMT